MRKSIQVGALMFGTLVGLHQGGHLRAQRQVMVTASPADTVDYSGIVLPAATYDVASNRSLATISDPRLVEQLGEIGKRLATATMPAEIAHLNVEMADALTIAATNAGPAEKCACLRQITLCLFAAASNSLPEERSAIHRLEQLEKHVVAGMPDSELAAFVTFHEIQAAKFNLAATSAGTDQWKVRLAAFVEAYPSADEAPEAWMELATVSELLGDKAEAQRCYGMLAAHHEGHPLAVKAEGALRRLGLDGKTFHMALPLLYGESEHKDVVFDVDQCRGHVVVVYFWAGWEPSYVQDLATLKTLLDRNASQGLRLLCVSLNPTPQEAKKLLAGTTPPGTHVFQRGGLEGIVAKRFGVTVLPTVLVVGRNGKVVAQHVGIKDLERELERLAPTACHTDSPSTSHLPVLQAPQP